MTQTSVPVPASTIPLYRVAGMFACLASGTLVFIALTVLGPLIREDLAFGACLVSMLCIFYLGGLIILLGSVKAPSEFVSLLHVFAKVAMLLAAMSFPVSIIWWIVSNHQS